MFGVAAFAEVSFTDLTVVTAYKLTCSAGSYALTGNNATLTVNRKISAAMAMPNNASTSAPVPYISARSTTGFTVTFAGTSTNWFWFAIGY